MPHDRVMDDFDLCSHSCSPPWVPPWSISPPQAGAQSSARGEGSMSIMSPNDNNDHESPNAVPVSGTDSVKRGRGRPKVCGP